MIWRIKKLLILCMIIPMIFISGCFDASEPDDLAYVVAMGLDKGPEDNLIITLLLAVPIAVGVGPEPGEIEKSTNIVTVAAPTILGGINVINSLISKRVNFAHAKLIVISKDLAEQGIEKIINTFIRFREFRPDTYLGITKGSAEEFLKSSKPLLEFNPSKHFELIMESFAYTGFSNGCTIEEFYSKMESTYEEAVALLLDVSRIQETKDLAEMISSRNRNGILEGDYTAGEIPVVYENKVRQMGSAVFRGDKMVGELTGLETFYYLVVSGKLGEMYFTLPDFNESTDIAENRDYITLRLGQARKPEISVKIKENIPVVDIKVSLEGDILAITGRNDYSTGEGLKKLEKYASEYIREKVVLFLEKTRDELNSDICFLGKYLKKTFLYWEDWIKFNWPEKYEKAQFNVNVEIKIRRSGIMVKQIPGII
ncbi:spore gernimation protein GerC [Thermoclostridium stercorarium subsp. thermolacticum DSM 2910]|uniref:Spore gernimation protein GerC n=2 Tax=Thermoclostridium stercorarium TaxID=1510 RepID=A0A1B1YKU8_THEST|nr:Ger(x)C family spore germination protein [Thermoclostridium stercorarium]ANW98883.1 spore gernimation protein GerC [Thermoclostridium stercorarium subsp. thermolacticum DSM 2910]ANX01410.1 spore gernimation protein GerC [Thermoclostridium stercorarium subsp. leptospartum DSM 9219]UZQ84518.1 Ger(x)C family spore germination protein [Thermoclostridium stercorarium]